ncbi:hypothetical protein Tco_0716578 [Tanacetum coccineum]
MATPDLNGTHTTPCLSNLNPAKPKTNNNVKIEISKELLMKLRNNAYNGAEANDAVDHIARFLHIIDLVKIPNVDPEQLCISAFPYSLTGGARSNYGVICEDEAKRGNSGAKMKTFEENSYLLPYAVSSKEDTTYQCQLITRIRVSSIPDSAYHS